MFNNIKISRVAVWNRYSRHSNAAFLSMGRVVKIGVLTVAMVQTSQLCAQTDQTVQQVQRTEQENAMAEVTVSGTMTPLTEMQQVRIVEVITRDEINRAAGTTVNDILKSVAGIDVRQRGAFGIQTDISVDGGTFDQVTILLNGVCINNPQTGHLTADLPVTVADIERIEILEGAASRVYGAGAFGGAINIVTTGNRIQPGAPIVTAGAEAGSWGSVNADARVGGAFRAGSGVVSNALSGGYARSDGGVDNSDFRRFNLFWQGGSSCQRWKIDWQVGWAQKQYGANTFYSAKFPNQWEGNRRYLADIKSQVTLREGNNDGKGRITLRPQVGWNRTTDHFQLVRNTSTGENFHTCDVVAGNVMVDATWAGGKTAVGVDVRHERILSTNLGEPMQENEWVELSYHPGMYYKKRDARTQVAFNAEHTLVLDHWTLSAGLMAAMNNGVDYRWRVYPGMDIAWRPNNSLKVYASYNKGFRMPTFTDLYYSGAERQGNGALRPEETHCVSMGVQYKTRRFTIKSRVFYHRGKHMIDWVKYTPTDDVYYAADFNLDNLGAQISADVSLPHAVRMQAGYTYIKQWRVKDYFKSGYAGEYLRNKFTASLMHPIWRPLSMRWDVRVCDRIGSDYTPYAVLDAKLLCKLKSIELWVKGENLTDNRYYDLGGVQQPGICIMAGARWRL